MQHAEKAGIVRSGTLRSRRDSRRPKRFAARESERAVRQKPALYACLWKTSSVFRRGAKKAKRRLSPLRCADPPARMKNAAGSFATMVPAGLSCPRDEKPDSLRRPEPPGFSPAKAFCGAGKRARYACLWKPTACFAKAPRKAKRRPSPLRCADPPARMKNAARIIRNDGSCRAVLPAR